MIQQHDHWESKPLLWNLRLNNNAIFFKSDMAELKGPFAVALFCFSPLLRLAVICEGSDRSTATNVFPFFEVQLARTFSKYSL